MVCNNGTYDYSMVIQLSQISVDHALVYPNPTKDYIYVIVMNANAINIYNTSGILVKQQPLQAGSNKIDIRNLSAGMYYAGINGARVRVIKKISGLRTGGQFSLCILSVTVLNDIKTAYNTVPIFSHYNVCS